MSLAMEGVVSDTKSADSWTWPELTPVSGYHPCSITFCETSWLALKVSLPKGLSLPILSLSKISIVISVSPWSGMVTCAS